MIDLQPRHLETVIHILAGHVPECEVRAYGSRVKGSAREYSDLDLAIVGNGPLDWRVIGRLMEAFEDSDLPFRVDVIDWNTASEGFRSVVAGDWVVLCKTGNEQGYGSR